MSRTDEIMEEVERLADKAADEYMAAMGSDGIAALMCRTAFRNGFIKAVTVMAQARKPK